MFRRASLFSIMAGIGWAQFTQLAATDDGQQLYFTSMLRLFPGSPARPENRVYHFGPNGLELFAERGALSPNSPNSISGGSSDGIIVPQVSGDGALVGLTAVNICPNGGPCATPSNAEGLLRGSKTADLGPGYLQLSRNGRWAVLTQHIFSPPTSSPPTETDIAVLIDLQTGQSVSIPSPAADFGMIASNGALLVKQTSPPGAVTFGIWRQGSVTPLVIAGAFRPWALSDDAGTLVFTRLSATGAGPSLVTKTIATGVETTLYASNVSTQFPNFLGMTNDGSQVLYNVSTTQAAGLAYIANAANGTSTLLPLDPGELATAGTLSGSGNVAYLATTEGRIAKFTIGAGIPALAGSVVPPARYISNTLQFSPGSMVQLQGALPASQDQLAGSIVLDGNPLPILYAAPGDIRAQVPWEQKTGLVGLTVRSSGATPFQQSDLVIVTPIAPMIEAADSGQPGLLGLKFVKADFSGLVTSQPKPGDILITYFTGLGVVTGSPQTGVPTPTTTLFPIQGQLTCQFLPQQSPMQTLFTGLAPLMIGIYQVAFQLPPDAGQVPIMGLQCNLNSSSGSASFGIFSGLSAPSAAFVPMLKLAD